MSGFAQKVTKALFSVQPLCSLCLGGVFLLGIRQPQRHREHRGCTEKSICSDFLCKAAMSQLSQFYDSDCQQAATAYHYPIG